MKRLRENDLEMDLALPDNDEEGSRFRKPLRERYVVTVKIFARADDIDLAEDAISDLITEAMDKLSEGYKPDVEILDYYLDEIEPSELS